MIFVLQYVSLNQYSGINTITTQLNATRRYYLGYQTLYRNLATISICR